MRNLFLLFVFSCSHAFANSADTLWTYYGNSEWGQSSGVDICEVSDHGLIVVGCADCRHSEPKGLVIKLDENGQEQWSLIIPSILLNGVVALDNGDIVVCGRMGARPHTSQSYCARISDTGEILWSWKLNESCYSELEGICLGDSNIYCAGPRHLEGRLADFLVIKMSLSGDTLWTQVYGDWDTEKPRGLVANSVDGGVLVFGSKYDDDGHGDSYVVSFSPNGDTRWTALCRDSLDDDAAFDAVQTSEGWAVLSSVVRSEWDWEIMLSLLSRNGETLKTERFSTDSELGWVARSMAATQNHKLVIAFSTMVDRSSNQTGLLYLKSNYKMMKIKEIEGGKNYTPKGLIVTNRGHIVSCGDVVSRKNYETNSESEVNPQPPDTRLRVMKLKP